MGETHDPSFLNAGSKPSTPFSSFGPTILRINHLWNTVNVTTDICYYHNIPDMPREGQEGRRVYPQQGSHNKNLSRCLLDSCKNHYSETGE